MRRNGSTGIVSFPISPVALLKRRPFGVVPGDPTGRLFHAWILAPRGRDSFLKSGISESELRDYWK